MPPEKAPTVWITPIGQTLYENLNPYWLFCEKAPAPPDRIVLLHAVEMEAEKKRVADAMNVVFATYESKGAAKIDAVAFDDENVQKFTLKIGKLFKKSVSKKQKLIVDVSPTTWSYVPIFLMKMAQTYPGAVQSVFYLQYVDHAWRNRPHPLIPYKSILLHDLLAEPEYRKEQ